MRKHLLVPLFIFSFAMAAFSQAYSPYFFLDTLKDKGITSKEHKIYRNKVYFDAPDCCGESKVKKDSLENTVEFTPLRLLEANIFFDRSLRYYYAKYQSDPAMKLADWDYYGWKGNYFGRGGKNDTRYVGCLLYVLTVDKDTVATWKTSLFEKRFEEDTHFKFDLWSENFKVMSGEKDYFPLFTYFRSIGKPGTYQVKLDVYPGKLVCNSVRDRGPDLLATGTFKFVLTADDIKLLKDEKDNSIGRKFMDIDFDHQPIWGVKQ